MEEGDDQRTFLFVIPRADSFAFSGARRERGNELAQLEGRVHGRDHHSIAESFVAPPSRRRLFLFLEQNQESEKGEGHGEPCPLWNLNS